MSLNGLDDPKVKEAHETAVAEPGGWYALFALFDLGTAPPRAYFRPTLNQALNPSTHLIFPQLNLLCPVFRVDLKHLADVPFLETGSSSSTPVAMRWSFSGAGMVASSKFAIASLNMTSPRHYMGS